MLKNISKRSLFLILCDAASVSGAYFLSWFLWTGGQRAPQGIFPLGVLIIIFVTFFYIFDLYYPFKRFRGAKIVVDVVLALGLGTLIYGLFCFATRDFFLPRPVFAYFIIQVCGYVLIARLFYGFIFESRFLDRRTAILGTGDMAREIHALIQGTPYSGMDIVGHVSERGAPRKGNSEIAVLGSAEQLLSILSWHNISLLILAFDKDSQASEIEIMRLLAGRDIRIISGVHLFEKLSGAIPYEVIDPQFILSLGSDVRARHFLHLKRLLDIAISASLLVLTLPLSVLTCLLLSMQGIGKIFFVQKRVGKGGKLFSMYKFRSMSSGKGKELEVTSLGRILRKFRIDELPQFLNVLKGDMSLIGPRPETVFFANKCRRYIPYYNLIFTVQPGISGWAQVKFSHVSDFKDYPKKFCYNVYYLKNISLALDLQILLKTIRSVLLGKGK